MPNEKVELHTNQHCTIVPSKFEDFDNNFNEGTDNCFWKFCVLPEMLAR